jgi:hypothetical protein
MADKMKDKMKDPIADKEKAEGDRETVDQALANEGAEAGAPQGITNRPIEEEEAQQRELPPRGTAKRED